MINISVKVNSINKLNKHIQYVEKLAKMKTDIRFQKEIQDRVLETVNRITEQRLVGGTTNDDAISEYKKNHKIRPLIDKNNEEIGFELYNDTKVPANVNGVQNDISNYPEGMFSVALAFEYGVGIVGSNTSNPNAWKYNINTYNQDKSNNYGAGYLFGWYLPKDVANEYGINGEYGGYQGFEIYRYTAKEIETMLPKWVNDYFRKYGGVSQ